MPFLDGPILSGVVRVLASCDRRDGAAEQDSVMLFDHGDARAPHLTSVFQSIGVTDRTQAALWAQRHGLA